MIWNKMRHRAVAKGAIFGGVALIMGLAACSPLPGNGVQTAQQSVKLQNTAKPKGSSVRLTPAFKPLALSPSEIASFDQEYGAFKTQALTESYIGRKLTRWFGTSNDPSMLRELIYGCFRHPEALRNVFTGSSELHQNVRNMPAVLDRSSEDSALDLCLTLNEGPPEEPPGDPESVFQIVHGRVLNSADDQPLSGARVVIPSENGSDPDLVVFTNAQGYFSFPQVGIGRKAVLVSKEGQSTQIEVTVVQNHTNDLGNIRLNVYTGPTITVPPLITIDTPSDLLNNVVSSGNPVFVVSGRVENLDSQEIAFIVNGTQEKISVDGGGYFSHNVILSQPGQNEILVRAANALGTSQERVLVDYQIAQIGLQVRLQWDTDQSDVDLHLLDPLGRRTFYSATSGIPNSQLDVDDTDGYGPENITMPNVPLDVPGRYQVGAIYYSSSVTPETKAFVEITLNAGTPQQLKGNFEYLFTAASGSSAFPTANTANTWRVADIIIGPNGERFIVAPGAPSPLG